MADPRVFFSYSHDSDAHRDAVLQLAQQLRGWGIDVQLDRFVSDPPEGWPRWMIAQIDAADLVILVCTATYRRRFEGQETPGKGKGVTFEGLLAIQHLYDSSTRNRKFIPVVLEGTAEDDVPLVLRPYTRYTLPGQLDQLYRRLIEQPEIVAAPLGPRKIMPPRAAALSVAPPLAATTVASAPLESRTALPAAPVRSAGGRDVAITPLDALHHLLLALFTSGEDFRQWVARGPDGPGLVAHFPGATASPSAMILGGLDVLQRRGYVEDDFFARLATEFKRRRDVIDRVATAWRSAPAAATPREARTPLGPSTHGGFHFGSGAGRVHLLAGGDIVAGDKHVATGGGSPPSPSDARNALDALRTALAARSGGDQKLARALDDAADELAGSSPDRTEVADALARALKQVARTAPDTTANPDIASPLSTLTAWLGPDGDHLRRT